MKLEISIKASSLARQALLAGLAALVPEQHIEETGCSRNSKRITLTLFLDANNPDDLLQKIASETAKIENHYPDELGIDVYVRNSDYSEPDLYSLKQEPFSPVEGFRIVPWNGRNNTPPASHDIILDPAHAFGTGLHPSTRLCLQLLKLVHDKVLQKNYGSASVLDIGCGSGILTIAALRLGATRALGIEIDPEAVQVARRNMQRNRLENRAHISESSWQTVNGTYDLILANLVPSVLYKAAPAIAELIGTQGLLITAGFPASKKTKVYKLFNKKGLHLLHEASVDGWGALLLAQ